MSVTFRVEIKRMTSEEKNCPLSHGMVARSNNVRGGAEIATLCGEFDLYSGPQRRGRFFTHHA